MNSFHFNVPNVHYIRFVLKKTQYVFESKKLCGVRGVFSLQLYIQPLFGLKPPFKTSFSVKDNNLNLLIKIHSGYFVIEKKVLNVSIKDFLCTKIIKNIFTFNSNEVFSFIKLNISLCVALSTCRPQT